MELPPPLDRQQQKFEEKKRKQSQALEPISLETFKQKVEQDLNLKQQDFYNRLDEADNIRKYGPAIEDRAELPYISRKMPPKQAPLKEITPAATPKRTEEDYLRSHVAMLENSIKSLKRENKVWISKYKTEARNRGIVIDLRNEMEEALSRQQNAEKKAMQYGDQIDIDKQLIRKLRLQIIDLKKSVHKREMVAVHSEDLNDLLYKPKLETLSEEHDTLGEEYSVLKQHFETLYKELSKFQSGARLKERKQRMKKAIEEALKRKKKAKEKGGRKRRGKNDPLKVWEQIEKALKINIDKRKRFRAQNELFIENSNQQNEVTDHGTNENEMDMPKQYTVISPLQSSSAVLPLRNYTIAGNISKTLLTEIPEISINNLYAILSKAVSAYLNKLNTEKDTINLNISFGETLIDVLIDIYEVWPVIQMYIHGVIETIKHYAGEEHNNVRVAFFGRLLGIINPELYNERACSTFLPILNNITKGKLEFALTGNLIYQHDENISQDACYFVPMKVAKAICEKTFKNFEVKYENYTLALKPEIYEQLTNNLIQYSQIETDELEVKRNGGSNRKIDLDTFLAITLNAWYEQANHDLNGLSTTVWEQFGCVEEQVFDIPLLKDILGTILPKEYTREELKLIYKQLMSCQTVENDVGKGLNVSDGTVTRENFAMVLHAYGISPFKSVLTEEELLEIAKKKHQKEKEEQKKKNRKKKR